jgi:hypothetical protein
VTDATTTSCRICPAYGKDVLQQPGRGRPKTYCSTKCQIGYRRTRETLTPAAKVTHCLSCDTEIEQPAFGVRKYCSTRCRRFVRLHPGEKLNLSPTCRACGEPIDPARGINAKHCNVSCARWARLYPGRPKPIGRHCEQCGESIEYLMLQARYCSTRCGDNARRLENPEKYRTKKVSDQQNRKAAQLAAGGLGVNSGEWESLLLIYNGACAYCGKPCAAVRDHVWPLARGGRYEIANMLPACARCNMTKSDFSVDVWVTRRDRDEPGWRDESPLSPVVWAALTAWRPSKEDRPAIVRTAT